MQEPPPPPASGAIEPELCEIRKDWEKVCLRRLCRKTLEDDVELTSDIMRKRKFSDSLGDIEINWTAPRHWARKVLQEAGLMASPKALQRKDGGFRPKTPDLMSQK